MRAALSTLEVARPRDVRHALALLHESVAGERLVPLAGGTDLYVSLNAGVVPGRRFLDLGGLSALRGVRDDRGALEIGALTTFAALREHPAVRRRAPALAAAAATIGAWQVQCRATLGGNIGNASPAGDSLPVLLAHEAIVRLLSVRGARDVAFRELFRGYKDLALEPDEIIGSITLPASGRGPAGARPFFRKVGTRRAQAIAKVSLAGLLRVGRDGRVDAVRVALGSVAPVPVRAARAERVLFGARPSAAVACAARAALLEDVSPIDDIRSDREYRERVAGNLLEQFLRSSDARFAR